VAAARRAHDCRRRISRHGGSRRVARHRTARPAHLAGGAELGVLVVAAQWRWRAAKAEAEAARRRGAARQRFDGRGAGSGERGGAAVDFGSLTASVLSTSRHWNLKNFAARAQGIYRFGLVQADIMDVRLY